jgi:hypothetical protein
METTTTATGTGNGPSKRQLTTSQELAVFHEGWDEEEPTSAERPLSMDELVNGNGKKEGN